MESLVHKNVEQQLLGQRNHQRPNGETIYCFPYTKDILDFDNWDFLFQTKYCCRNGLTMNQFDTPPQMVLDVGCGAGLWTIEAAKQWKESKIIGFDFLNIMPPKSCLPTDIAARIEWVRGNFLEGLPFPSNCFDLVRAVRIGFHIPEDEGQTFLEEIHRVMKPGGVAEFIEEDLIFPRVEVPSTPKQKNSSEAANEIPIFPSLSISANNSSKSHVYSNFASSSTELSGRSSDPFSLASYRSSGSSHNRLSVVAETFRDTPQDLEYNHTRLSENVPRADPRDYSQLKQAWEGMIQKVFLALRLTSVLELYLRATFPDVQSHPPLQVSMPPNSSTLSDTSGTSEYISVLQDSQNADLQFDARTTSNRSSTLEKSSVSSQHPRVVSSSASMHLAKTVCTVIACKENIWEAYLEIFGKELSSPPIIRSSRAQDIRYVDTESIVKSARDVFEKNWSNWERDMKDRMGVRGNIRSELKWSEPPGDTPDWRVWRNSAKTTNENQANPNGADLCRSIRAFVVWKDTPEQTKARERRNT